MATPTPPPKRPDFKVLWTRFALFVAIIGVLGSLHHSINMELQACPLCYYQRAFMMAAAGILAFGLFMTGVPTQAVTVLALIPAAAGACIAIQHERLEWTGVLECPKGVTGVLSAPQESLLIYLLLVATLLGDLFHRRVYILQGVAAVLLGFVFCTTCLKSVQRMPERTTPYEKEEPDGCRKPFKKS